MTALTEPAVRPPSIFDSAHRLAMLGVLLVITVAATEAMAVAAVMPVTVKDLGGLALYGWAFTGFFLADVVGIVDGGVRSDRHGPVQPLVGGLLLFAGGLLVAGLAPNMVVFVLGRAIQGYGAGAVIVATYVLLARLFEESLRPRAFAAISAAWILPALIGPTAAGAVAEHIGWRWVFLGIAPLAVLGLLLLSPVLSHVPSVPPGDSDVRRGGTAQGVLLAAGLTLLQLSAQHLRWWSAPVAVVAVAMFAPPLRRLLPPGALIGRRGLPTVVVLRGLITAAFFGAEAYLPLTLTQVHGFGPTMAGLPLTIGALGWSAGSWLQGRLESDRARTRLLAGGFVAVALCVGLLAFVAWEGTSPWVALPLWLLGGTGMGMAMPVISVLMLQLSPPHEQGANSAALQVSDMTGGILTIGAGGALVALAQDGHLSFSPTIAAIDITMALIALGGAALSRRATPR